MRFSSPFHWPAKFRAATHLISIYGGGSACLVSVFLLASNLDLCRLVNGVRLKAPALQQLALYIQRIAFFSLSVCCLIRYASLFFIACVDARENALLVLEVVHHYVEVLDKYFGNVCELDLIFNFHKVRAPHSIP